MTLRVWAPNAREVSLLTNGQKHPMQKTEAGWWSHNPPPPGTDYQFSIDQGPPLPDPRSPHQPDGPHGPSRTIDHKAFAWTDQHWQAPELRDAIIYELHTGTFTPEGTLEAAIGKLDYLTDLGITHLELMPVAEFSGDRGWGYDGVDLYAPHHAYGGPDAPKRLVDACHAKGLAVLLDVVYNHLGPSGNYLDRFGPYFTDRFKTPWGKAVNFDGPGSDEVRRFVCDNALMWLRDYHFDGLRLDAVHAILDTSAVHILEQLESEVERLAASLGRHLVLIAESDLNDPRLLWPQNRGGYGLDAQWSDDFHHAVHALLSGERAGYYQDFGGFEHLAQAMQDAFVYQGQYSAFRQRSHGRRPEGLGGDRFVVCTQNHDQVGNRARGDRLSHMVSPGRLKIAAALLLTSPFVPMLFQGEEWAASAPFQYFTDHREPDLAKAVSDGRRREFAAFGWSPSDVPDPQSPETLQRSKLDWSELDRDRHRDVHDWYKALIALRRTTPALTDNRLDQVQIAYDEAKASFQMTRGPVTVAFNLGPEQVTLAIPGHPILTSEGATKGVIPPDGVSVSMA